MDIVSYLLGSAKGGGGGGGDTGNVVVLQVWDDATEKYSLNKTMREIITAYNAGKLILTFDSETFPVDMDNPSDASYADWFSSVGFDTENNAWWVSTTAGTSYYAAALDDYPTDQL